MGSTAAHDAVVIGAGPAGLAAAASLSRAGVRVVVLERASSIGASWRGRYDGLRLNTNRWLSHLPGGRYPRGTPRFPSRDQVVTYLERYAEDQHLDVRLGTEARQVERIDGHWRVSCSGGDLEGHRVVVATGWESVPHIPDWPGRARFTGELIHAAAYRSPDRYRDRDVLVVGPGCTGAEIAFFVRQGGAARVRLAVRTAPHLVLRHWGIPVDLLGVIGQSLPARVSDPQARILRRLSIGDLSEHGLPRPPQGMLAGFRKNHRAPTTVDREVIDAIRQRRIEIVAAVVGFTECALHLADGSVIEPDAVIAATGYRRGLEPLVGHLGVLDIGGTPRVWGAQTHPAAPDLYFIGFDPKIGGTLRQIRLEAKRLRRAC